MAERIAISDIDKNISLINDALDWGAMYRADTFRNKFFKDCRRELKKIKRAVSSKCSAAAYGESQVGKSYLMGSLLSSSESPLMIRGNGREYNFVNELNQSGGSNAEVESTGVITRFTLRRPEDSTPEGFVKIRNLSVVDIILMLADSYHNDITTDANSGPDKDRINNRLLDLRHLFEPGKKVQDVIDEDDIRDIMEYLDKVVGRIASPVLNSNFAEVVAPAISSVPMEKWGEVFGLLWNENPHLTSLFNRLIQSYSSIGFREDILVPFDAVLRENGTLLKIDWLEAICDPEKDMGRDILDTDIYDVNGNLIAAGFPKSDLSALIAELTFEIPESLAEKRTFLRSMDLLDFPGARSRESFPEDKIAVVLPSILRRGKVAYLFNKYSRNLLIGSVLFCHHNDQKSENKLGDTITKWVEENIGETPRQRAQVLERTDGISPLFMVATKFNKDLEKLPTDLPGHPERLDDHWDRFNKVIPEIVGPATWMENFTERLSGITEPFKALYPLRGYHHSAKAGLFKGYSETGIKSPETAPGEFPDYPDYMEQLRKSFVNNDFVKRHFEDPDASWHDVATVNHDGSAAIISKLDKISVKLDDARRANYLKRLYELKKKVLDALEGYYVPDNPEEKSKKVRESARNIRQDLTAVVSANPTAFGKIIEQFMVEPEQLRNIAHAIVVRHTEAPDEFRREDFIKANAGVNIHETRDVSIKKLQQYLMLTDEEELREYLTRNGFDLDTMLSANSRTITTISALVARRIMEAWENHLDATAASLAELIPHADTIVELLKNLSLKIEMEKSIDKKIAEYRELFNEREQPNVIGDFASLLLNRFVSTIGKEYIDDEEFSEIKKRAELCGISEDLESLKEEENNEMPALEETLNIFDRYAEIINNPQINMSLLNRLPFWNNYRNWEKSIIAALVFTSEISDTDPVANDKMKTLIEETEKLYL